MTHSLQTEDCLQQLAMRLPVDDDLMPELAFPNGMEVFVGPLPGLFGRIDWSSDGPLPCCKFTAASTMRKVYYPAVPVRVRGMMAGITWHHPRWVIPTHSD